MITGGTSGIGLAGAQRIVTEDSYVAITAITGRNEERLEHSRSMLPVTSLVMKSDAAGETDILRCRKLSVGKSRRAASRRFFCVFRHAFGKTPGQSDGASGPAVTPGNTLYCASLTRCRYHIE